LHHKEREIICKKCGKVFSFIDGFPIMFGNKFDNDIEKLKKLYDDDRFIEDNRENLQGMRKLIAEHSINKILDTNFVFIQQFLQDALVLEIGCGMGQLTEKISLSEAKEIYAFDLSVNNLVYTRDNRGKNNVFLFLGNALEIPFRDNFFDIVVASEVIEHVPDVKRMINEMRRVCKRGGKICVSTPNANIVFYPRFFLLMLLKPLTWVKRLKRVENWNRQGIYDRWFFPVTLKKLFNESDLKILKYKTAIYFYWRGLFYYFCLFLEKIGLYPVTIIQAYLRITDFLVENEIPVFKRFGTRQFFLLEKPF
jgi:demethylmenaquinone methyltransferase/2-methoxy-6-polyprenyl-1,4-benzoquinol methylase